MSLLALSDKWQFEEVRQLAIEKIQPFQMDPIDKIDLCQRYSMGADWAFDAYVTMCSRNSSPSVAEAKRLGSAVVALICMARERLERHGRGKPTEVRKMVSSVFDIRDPQGGLLIV